MNLDDPPESIAIIGMAGRLPNAATLEEFWSNLREGREAISFFKDEEVQWLPIEHQPVRNDPRFVRARASIDRPEWFDAAFFRLNPREAAIMDPQHRLILECAWEALEIAGCNPESFAGSIGVFAGVSINTYLFNNLLTNRMLLADFGLFAGLTMNEKDYLSTRVAYKLNLRGPCINVQTACSTSLVAVTLACQNLLGYHCDVALAGGVSLTFPANRGHYHVEGGIMSKDGHCRAFDAKASGTVTGNGAGVVVLKRLSEALAAGDRICAVIKGSAINNDGGVKMGFTAPSIDGQAECIALAQAMARFEPETISYVEAHGTGTPLGDPIEMSALKKAFGAAPGTRAFCAVGSVKTNLGHLDVAAGVVGLIKTTLALQHGEIPPSLHYETPNPEIDFKDSPFFVNDRLRTWPRGATPRRAGVSSFGIGGTNAHVVLEEAPAPEPGAASRPHQLLLLSARTPTALKAMTENLASHLERHPELNLSDVAFTLQTGRKVFEHCEAVVVAGIGDSVAALRSREGRRLVQGGAGGSEATVVFMFPGQGAQAVNMARDLYETESAFRKEVDCACEIVNPKLGLDLRKLMFPSGETRRGPTTGAGEPEQLLAQTRITQPALFVIEYALARLWMGWGIRPSAMIGHSLGEYVAACIAGVFTLEDGLAIVAERARLMQAQPAGAMLATRLPEARLLEWLDHPLALAAVNAPGSSVVSGPFDAIEALERKLAANAIPSRRLATSHAFHSAMMDPALPPLADFLRRFVLRPPAIPWVSNVTGTWITPEQATNPDYWATQLRRTVRFADGIGEIVRAGHRILLEVGPGQTLAGLARQHTAVATADVTVASTLRCEDEDGTDLAAMLHALGQLWVSGAKPAWHNGFYTHERRRIVALPTYPFERKRHWIEPGTAWMADTLPTAVSVARKDAPAADQLKGSATPGEPTDRNGTATLSVVMNIFRELSGIDLSHAAAQKTFNQLGFDSLFLTQASVVVGRHFGVVIAFRQLRDDLSTLGKLAAHVDRHAVFAGSGVSVVVSELVPPAHDAEKRISLTEAQREIWVVSQLGVAESAAYIESATMKLTGPLDVDALRRALRQLVARHEALRTTFAEAGDRQIIAATSALELSFHDYSAEAAPLPDPGVANAAAGNSAAAASGRNAAARAAACIDHEFERPFNLVAGPLFRPVLARIDSQNHLLVLIVHHIICDGWSLGILVRELAEIYAAEVARRRPELLKAPLFTAYAAQQATQQQELEFAAAEAYWREHFADSVPILDWPTDRPRPVNRSYAGDFVCHTLSPELTTAVKRLCAERESTVFTTLLAAFNVLLHRLTGQADVVVGVPAAVQALDGQPDLVGHFANLLPIRSRLSENQGFSDYLREVQLHLDQALAHRRYPFVRLLQQLKLARDSSRVPLTPVLFNTSNHPGTVKFGDVTATPTVHPKAFVNFDLNFNLAVSGESLALGCYYSTELFDRSTVTRWLGHFETLLRGIVAQPERSVSELPLLTDAERQQLLVRWNDTQLPYERDAVIAALFEAQVARRPEAIAIVAENERMTYRELNARADRLATRLRTAGVGADSLVGIFLERTPQLLVAIFGILKAGGAYVPLDPKYPSDRLDFIVSDTRMPIMVTQQSLAAQLPAGGFDFMLIDDERPATAHVSPHPTPPDREPATATSLAYIIYTSGSTGRPKGVGIVQRCVVALVAWARQLYHPKELDGVLFSTSASFDISIFEIFCPLCLGGRIVMAENILHLATLPAANDIRFLSGVPSAVAEVVRLNLVPPSVTTVALAGETVPQSLVDAIYALPHIRRVFELYGPTETTVYSTGGLRMPNTHPTLGRPFPNEQIYVLDRQLQPVPIGVHGEIFIGGDKLARGYLNRPELTAEKFIASPFTPGERLYRSGDVGKWCADGTIESLGRVDHQVKVRGFRIELGEIEAALAQHPAVAECTVIARPDSSGLNQLLAYAVPRRGLPPGSRELRDHLQQQLPAYMVPTSIMLLDQLPRTANGKVDRRALPEPVFGTANSGGTLPRNTTEQAVSAIWCDVLGLEQAGVHDNFFELGGHSLYAMQVISRLQESLGVELTWRQFFAAPTIAGMAPVIELAMIADIQAAASKDADPVSPRETPHCCGALAR